MPQSLVEMLQHMRSTGWRVAVHNDYIFEEKLHTRWLFTTTGSRYVMGTGPSDEEAVEMAVAKAKKLQSRSRTPAKG